MFRCFKPPVPIILQWTTSEQAAISMISNALAYQTSIVHQKSEIGQDENISAPLAARRESETTDTGHQDPLASRSMKEQRQQEEKFKTCIKLAIFVLLIGFETS